MKRGFTLLELLIVIIIVGVMATLGLTQYTAVVERSRGAEARQILGQLRSVCAALYMENNTVDACTTNKAAIGLGTSGSMIPQGNSNACAANMTSHFFQYDIAAVGTTGANLTAYRCTANGKTPKAANAGQISLTVDYSNGTAVWASPNGY